MLDTYIRKIPGGRINSVSVVPREYQCPSRLDETGFAYERTYGMNTNCGGWMSATSPAVVVPVRQVRYPQATIRIAEVEWENTGGSWIAALPTEDTGSEYDHRFAERHNGKGNVLWIDGHVSAMTRDQYNMRDTGAYSGQIWLRLEGPKPAVP